jgi:A/G-specific adenine glycosylase
MLGLNLTNSESTVTQRHKKIRNIVNYLLEWFSTNARDLPWRRTTDPYCIYVSEIMLQQTQVKTVIPYWERWMRVMPTVESLAAAKPEVIHKLWEGLGYYTRVRNMQKAAREIIATHQGQFPQNHDAILALPGIGRYTAGAISSIAFNEPRPILDGNVIRVLTRVFGIAENPREKTTNEKLWRLAEELVNAAARSETHDKHPTCCSHLNQSLMELGALICTPKQPKCLLCPIQTNCEAYRTGRVDQLPNLGPRTVATSRRFAAFVVEDRDRFLVRQRPDGVVNAHLWEFPNVEVTSKHAAPDILAKEGLGLDITSLEKLCVIKHSITRYRISLEAFYAKAKNQKVKLATRGQWFKPEELDSFAFTSAHRKVLKCLEAKIKK